MKCIVPDYYSEFACLMGACRHSCCIGWEIDIDEESLAFYRSCGGEMGRRLAENIALGNDGACFRLGEGERCPFLNGEGLCDLIINLGEDSLCQICADHPRYRNFFSDREELGLGLCCEAAGRLILGRRESVRFVVLADDGENDVPDADEQVLLDLREELMQIAQDRSLPMELRVGRMLEAAGLPSGETELPAWVDFLLGLERLDERWGEVLKAFEGGVPELADAQRWELPLEQLMVYLLHRHLPAAVEDDDSAGRVALAVFLWRLVRGLLACADAPQMEDFIELCRLCSSELEYSDENIAAILEELHARCPEL